MTWNIKDPMGNEAAKISHMVVPYTRGKVLDLGAGPFKCWPHFTSCDNFDEYVGYMDPMTGGHWRPDIEGDVTEMTWFSNDSWDAVFSSHLLEHLEDTEKALTEWWRVIKPHGCLVLYLPDKTFYPNIGKEGSNPDHKHDFVPQDIINIMKKVGGWNLLEKQRRDQDMEYSFYLVFQKRDDTKHKWDLRTTRMKKGQKTCLITRYGGFGDMIQVSSVLPQLKKQGYWITMNTTPRGHQILKADPHIDDWWLQDIDQVPNITHLDAYWKGIAKEFDHSINFSEIVEETLLAVPGGRRHALSKEARHALMNVNYLEFHHAHAQLPFEPNARFYPTDEEREAAQEFREEHKAHPLIMWTASGSSVHKHYPWADRIAMMVMEKTDAKIMVVGNKEDQLVERGMLEVILKNFTDLQFDDSKKMKLSELIERARKHFGVNRFLCTSGQWNIRQVLTQCEYVDLIIGPETGVLNAAGALETPKICLLSHSTIENLTKHWQNTMAAAPEMVECYPCHRMHYNRDFCPVHEGTGAALCQALIPPEDIFRYVLEVIPEKRKAA